mgnify:CR=1 FL=1
MAAEINKEKITEVLTLIGEYLNDAMLVELLLQGHKASGKLADSISSKVTTTLNSVLLTGEFEYYGRFVDTGRKAGVRRVPIAALEAWIKQKGFESDAKKVRGMAFAIQRTIFEKGISTPESWKGETTKDFMTKTLTASEDKITADINAAVDAQMEIMIVNMVTETITLAKTYGIAA